jgi:hypothetical protein
VNRAKLRAFWKPERGSGCASSEVSSMTTWACVRIASQRSTLVWLSLTTVFRRRWPSTCDALSDGSIDTSALRGLFTRSLANYATVIRSRQLVRVRCRARRVFVGLAQQLQVVGPLAQRDVAPVVDVHARGNGAVAAPPHDAVRQVALADRRIVVLAVHLAGRQRRTR